MAASHLKQRPSMQQSALSTPVSNGEGVYNAKGSRKGCPTSCISKIEQIKCGGKPIVSGIDRVVFGTQPAAELVSIFGMRPPRYLFYMMSGIVCDIIQFLMDVCLHVVLEIKDASVCWSLGFFLSIVFRHTSHRYLVFGDYVGGYWKSLGRMYVGYSIIISLSTLFNVIMTKWAGLPHYVAWIVTLLWTGIVNYFILKKIWSFGGKQANTEATSAGTSNGDMTEAEIEVDEEAELVLDE
ncbi:unnamed protein product [Cylindrotheca closterium]|uniref:GtrA/DPMS transmembrane domain-containing protein n=1 Tax=Cylindrotheca closterium TaxID=2856 RepID=A0AAD2G9H0_9STRA|nr:unnamed protein product [Cylindrotheca closterium]